MKKKLAAVFIPLLLLFTVLAPAVQAEPNLPQYFYGTVLWNGSAAPAGTVIQAQVAGAISDGSNPITTTTIGFYGSPDPMANVPRLLVQGANITDNATVTFLVNGVAALQTANYHAGTVVELNLIAGNGQTSIGGGNAGGGGTGAGNLVQVSGLVPSTPLFLDGSGRVLNTSILSGPSFAFTLVQGTRAVDNNVPISNFSAVQLNPAVLPPPPNGSIILAYDFGPNGATFQPGISLTMNYDPATIPAGQKVKTIAYFDTVTNQWVQLQGTIDPTTNSITVTVLHFTRYAIVTEAESTDFVMSDMTMNKSTITVGEKVTVTATVGNYGNIAGTQTVNLLVDGTSMIDQQVTLDPGETTTVVFSVAMGTPGTYNVQIGDMTSTLVVEAAPTPTTTPTTQPTQTVAPTTTTPQPTQTTTAPTATTTTPSPTATAQPTQTTTSVAPTTPAASSGQNLTWIWILAGGVGAILVIGFITIAIRRRNS